MAEATSHLVIFIGGWGVEEYIQTLFQKCAWNQGLAEKGCNCLWMPQEGSKANPLPLMRQGPWVQHWRLTPRCHQMALILDTALACGPKVSAEPPPPPRLTAKFNHGRRPFHLDVFVQVHGLVVDVVLHEEVVDARQEAHLWQREDVHELFHGVAVSTLRERREMQTRARASAPDGTGRDGFLPCRRNRS